MHDFCFEIIYFVHFAKNIPLQKQTHVHLFGFINEYFMVHEFI